MTIVHNEKHPHEVQAKRKKKPKRRKLKTYDRQHWKDPILTVFLSPFN